MQKNLDDEATLNTMFRWLTGRTPTKTQLRIIVQLFESQLTYFQEHPNEQGQYLAVGRLPLDPNLDASQLAAYTTVANSLMNYDRALTRP